MIWFFFLAYSSKQTQKSNAEFQSWNTIPTQAAHPSSFVIFNAKPQEESTHFSIEF